MLQDTLKSSPPENKVMKKATLVGIATTTLFYVMCGCIGYAAFGNVAPGNFLTGFGFYEPFWLVDFANVCIAVHLIGAYQVSRVIQILHCHMMKNRWRRIIILCSMSPFWQVFCQPIFGFVEKWCSERWPESGFINREIPVEIPYNGTYSFSLFRLTWRTVYVIITALVAMIFPFFNDILGLLGAASFWPLTVYFPVEMYIARMKMKKYSFTWTWLKILSWACLVVSLVAAVGSVQGLVQDLKSYKPFSTQ